MGRRVHIALLAAALLLVGCGPTPSQGTGGGIRWSGAASVGGLGSGTINDVAANGTGFAAVGSFQTDGGHIFGGVWPSPDGSTWADTSDVGMHDIAVLRVVQGGPGLVAVAVDCQPGAGECSNASIWTSTDGAAWTMTARLDNCCTPAAVGRSTLGIVTVGSDLSTGFPQTPADAAAFSSKDGVSWTRATVDPSFKAASMGAVVGAGPGWVALGDAQAGPVAWTSSDGVAWSAVASPPGPGTARIRDATLVSGRILAVGGDAGQAASWTSPDGTAWAKRPSADSLKGGHINRAVAIGATAIAVGKNAAGSAIWISRDASTWTLSTTSKSADEFTVVAANGNRAVAMGTSTAGALVVLVGTVGAG